MVTDRCGNEKAEMFRERRQLSTIFSHLNMYVQFINQLNNRFTESNDKLHLIKLRSTFSIGFLMFSIVK